MRYLILIFLIIASTNVFAAQKKKAVKKTAPVVEADKTYEVEKHQPEIAIGEPKAEAPVVDNHFKTYWKVDILFTDLTFHLPAIIGGAPDFSQNAVGVVVGKKHDDQIFSIKGNTELSVQWQQFKRSTKVGPKAEFSQNINVYQVNLFQNFNYARAFQDSLIMTAGVGVAPIYLTSAESIYNNSISELGFQVMGKADFLFPIKKLFSWNTNHLAADIGLLASTGQVDSHTFSTLSASVGVNFE
jgi:hypothetical protein